jgi:membrane protease YdiL (CAAX protease family)
MRNSKATSSLRDPDHLLIAIMALLALFLVSGRMNARHQLRTSTPIDQISMQGRILEVQQGLMHTLGATAKAAAWKTPDPTQPWDRAILAILNAEAEHLTEAQKMALEGPLPVGAGAEFRRCWTADYLGEGAIPAKDEQKRVATALRNGYAAQLMEAKLATRAGQQPLARKLRSQAETWFERRAAALIVAGLGVVFGILGGLTFGVILAITWPRREAAPIWPASRILLGWFLALLVSGDIAALLLRLMPFLRPLSLPIVYGFHAAVGLALIGWAQGEKLAEVLRALFPKPSWRQLAWSLGFLSLGAAAVLLTGLALSPFLEGKEPPQKELMNLISGAQSIWMVVFMLFTAAVLAPIFEEILFRGTLMPWLESRLGKRFGARRAALMALVGSALVFGAIHLEPLALPSLVILGSVLALAFLRTRSLLSSVIVHGMWNGSILLFYRILMS